jgi:hypothetical protein
MRNPFKTTLVTGAPLSSSYSVAPSIIAADTNDTVQESAVTLDDVVYADAFPNPDRGFINDETQTWGNTPAYAGETHREILFSPEELPGYNFLSPTANSSDNLSERRDAMSIPGTNYLNVMDGPVTGSQMDVFQEGNRQQLLTTPPGYNGPVVGGTDYSQLVSQAYWQESFAQYSTAASTQALVSAV